MAYIKQIEDQKRGTKIQKQPKRGTKMQNSLNYHIVIIHLLRLSMFFTINLPLLNKLDNENLW